MQYAVKSIVSAFSKLRTERVFFCCLFRFWPDSTFVCDDGRTRRKKMRATQSHYTDGPNTITERRGVAGSGSCSAVEEDKVTI